jgi:hypothetical protein
MISQKVEKSQNRSRNLLKEQGRNLKKVWSWDFLRDCQYCSPSTGQSQVIGGRPSGDLLSRRAGDGIPGMRSGIFFAFWLKWSRRGCQDGRKVYEGYLWVAAFTEHNT